MNLHLGWGVSAKGYPGGYDYLLSAGCSDKILFAKSSFAQNSFLLASFRLKKERETKWTVFDDSKVWHLSKAPFEKPLEGVAYIAWLVRIAF